MRRTILAVTMGLAIVLFTTSVASADRWNRSWRHGVRQYNQNVRQFDRSSRRYWNQGYRYYPNYYGNRGYYSPYYYGGYPVYRNGFSLNFGNGGFYYSY
jgi:hypothetical protein